MCCAGESWLLRSEARPPLLHGVALGRRPSPFKPQVSHLRASSRSCQGGLSTCCHHRCPFLDSCGSDGQAIPVLCGLGLPACEVGQGGQAAEPCPSGFCLSLLSTAAPASELPPQAPGAGAEVGLGQNQRNPGQGGCWHMTAGQTQAVFSAALITAPPHLQWIRGPPAPSTQCPESVTTSVGTCHALHFTRLSSEQVNK